MQQKDRRKRKFEDTQEVVPTITSGDQVSSVTAPSSVSVEKFIQHLAEILVEFPSEILPLISGFLTTVQLSHDRCINCQANEDIVCVAASPDTLFVGGSRYMYEVDLRSWKIQTMFLDKSGKPQNILARDLVYDPSHHCVYVVSAPPLRNLEWMMKIDCQSKLLQKTRFRTPATPENRVYSGYALALYQEELTVWDNFGFLITFSTSTQDTIRTLSAQMVGGNLSPYFACGLAADASRFFVTDFTGNAVVMIDKFSGKLLARFEPLSAPRSVRTHRPDELIVVAQGSGEILILDVKNAIIQSRIPATTPRKYIDRPFGGYSSLKHICISSGLLFLTETCMFQSATPSLVQVFRVEESINW